MQHEHHIHPETLDTQDSAERSPGSRRWAALASVLAGLSVFAAGTAVAAGPSATGADLMPSRTVPPSPTNYVGPALPTVPLNAPTVTVGVGPTTPIVVGPAVPGVPIVGVPNPTTPTTATTPTVPTTESSPPTVTVIAAPAPPVIAVALPSIPVGQTPPPPAPNPTVPEANVPVTATPGITLPNPAYSCFANNDGPMTVRSGQATRSRPDPWENDVNCGELLPDSILLVERPSHGVLYGFGGETIEDTPYYVSDDGYVGSDGFTYRWIDADGSPISQVATYTFNVVERGVEANDDAYDIGYNSTLHVPAPGVLANDITADGAGTVHAQGHTPPDHGTLVLDDSGAFEYTPDPGWFGVDTFIYTLANLTPYYSSSRVLGVEATVTIVVYPRIPCWQVLYHCGVLTWPHIEIPMPGVPNEVPELPIEQDGP